MFRELTTGLGQDGGDVLLPLFEAWATGMRAFAACRVVGGRALHATLLSSGAAAWLLVGLSQAALFSVSVGSSLSNSEPWGSTVKCTIGMMGLSLACAPRTGYAQTRQKG